MSTLLERAIAAAQMDEILDQRRRGALSPEHLERLAACDLLVVGALADRARSEEVGDDVRIYVSDGDRDMSDAVVLPGPGRTIPGLELLRQVAMARLSNRPGLRVCIDWTRCGLEIAQIGLSFGANELAGTIASKRGLPLAEGDKLGIGKKSRLEPAEVVKRKELEGYVRRAGRNPSFA